jgi:transcriptional regulator with XRE-family HTH domain
MISSGAQIRAARGFLGWSQADLAKAAGLHVNCIRYYEAQHGRELHFTTQTGYAAKRITIALHKAGLEVMHDPPGVCVNRYTWNPDRRPPIFKRWERYWRPDSKPGKERSRQASLARDIRRIERSQAD